MNTGSIPESPGTPIPSRIRLWKTAALACSSACLGGIAVVLWHRRELQRMRQAERLAVREPEPPTAEFV